MLLWWYRNNMVIHRQEVSCLRRDLLRSLFLLGRFDQKTWWQNNWMSARQMRIESRQHCYTRIVIHFHFIVYKSRGSTSSQTRNPNACSDHSNCTWTLWYFQIKVTIHVISVPFPFQTLWLDYVTPYYFDIWRNKGNFFIIVILSGVIS